jgi:hypothetical protein
MRQYLTLLLVPVLLLVGVFAYHVMRKGAMVPAPAVVEEAQPAPPLSAVKPVQDETVGFSPEEVEAEREEQKDAAEDAKQGEDSADAPAKEPAPAPEPKAEPRAADRVITRAGAYGGGEQAVYDNVVVKASGVTFKNALIKGNLVLDKSLSAAVVGFENVQVLGSVYLYGTDGCRYSMKNVSAANVVVSAPKSETTLRLSGSIRIARLEVGSDVSLEGSSIVYDTETRYAVESLTVPQVPLHRVYVGISGLTVRELALRNIATLTLGSYSVVDTVESHAAAELRGAGHIGLLQAYADGTRYERRPDVIETGEGAQFPEEIRKETGEEDGKYHRLQEPGNLTVSFVAESGEYLAAWEAVEGASGYRAVCYVDGIARGEQLLEADATYFSLLSLEEWEQGKPDLLRVEVYALGDQRETLNSFISSAEYTYDALWSLLQAGGTPVEGKPSEEIAEPEQSIE